MHCEQAWGPPVQPPQPAELAAFFAGAFLAVARLGFSATGALLEVRARRFFVAGLESM